jgi:valyl-tRNA synthetase
LIDGWEVSQEDIETDNCEENIAVAWFDEVLQNAIVQIDDLFAKYRLSEALMVLYKLFWDDFCSWYLEMIKPEFGKPIDKYTYTATTFYFNHLLKLLHPFMPFITEELWQALKEMRAAEQDCISIMESEMPCVEDQPDQNFVKNWTKDILGLPAVEGNFGNDMNEEDDYTAENQSFDYEFNFAKEIIANIRTIRQQKNISPKEKLTLQILGEHNELFDEIIVKLANVTIETSPDPSKGGENGGAITFLVGTTEYAVPIGNLINVEEETKKIEAEIKYYEGFLATVMKKLSNEQFVANAKAEVVVMERKKQSDAESKLKSLRENLGKLK